MLCGLQTFSSGPPSRTGLEPDVTYHLFTVRNRVSVVTCLARGRPGSGPMSSLPFPIVEVCCERMNAGSWPGKYLASEPAVAETVVCVSRPHLNPSSVVSLWSGLGLSSLPFALVRASWLLWQFHPSRSEQCMQIPASPGHWEVPRAVVQDGLGVGAARATCVQLQRGS